MRIVIVVASVMGMAGVARAERALDAEEPPREVAARDTPSPPARTGPDVDVALALRVGAFAQRRDGETLAPIGGDTYGAFDGGVAAVIEVGGTQVVTEVGGLVGSLRGWQAATGVRRVGHGGFLGVGARYLSIWSDGEHARGVGGFVSAGAASRVVDHAHFSFDVRVHADALADDEGTSLVAGFSVAFIGQIADILSVPLALVLPI
jgi:hypothetical protein